MSSDNGVTKIQQKSSAATGDSKIHYKVTDSAQFKLLEENRQSQEQETHPAFKDVWPQVNFSRMYRIHSSDSGWNKPSVLCNFTSTGHGS